MQLLAPSLVTVLLLSMPLRVAAAEADAGGTGSETESAADPRAATGTEAEPTHADASDQGLSPYDPDLLLHGVLTTGMIGAVVLLRMAIVPNLQGGYRCLPLPASGHCDPATLNDLDRPVVWARSPGLAMASDITMIAASALPLAAIALDVLLSDSSNKPLDFLKDLIVVAEAMGTALVAYSSLAMLFRRARPNQYVADAHVDDFESQMSFPSGHAATVAAAAAAYSFTFGARHPDSPWRFAVYLSGAAMLAVTMAGRIADGRHFVTDVLAGAALGTACGLLVPWLHLKDDLDVVVAPQVGVGGHNRSYGLAAGMRF